MNSGARGLKSSSLVVMRPSGLRVIGEDVPGDAVTRGAVGKLAAGKPPRVFQLVRVDADLATRIAGHESHHELARERPVLAAHVEDVLDVDPDLLLDLALHGALQ